MKLKWLLVSSCIPAMCAFAAPATTPAAPCTCAPGEPTAASYTWNFKAEANRIFKNIRSDADDASYRTDRLQGFERDPHIDWQAHGEQLDWVRHDVNDMGRKLCRLESIRRVVAPWQQAEIDRIAPTLRLMADNTEDAITFGNGHPGELWLGRYRTYTDSLYDEAQTLSHSVGTAVSYANTSKDYQDLQRELGVPAMATHSKGGKS